MTSKITETKQTPNQLEQKVVGTEKIVKIPDCDTLFASDDAIKELFKDLAELYYKGHKFGTATKTDIDLIMFKHYFIQLRKRSDSNINGYSDFLISQELGITESRVSNLKVKTELRCQYLKDTWKKEFAKLLPKVRVEERKVKLYIPEKSIYLKVKNEIESRGEYIDIQLNGKLLQIPTKSFLTVVIDLVDDDTFQYFEEGIRRIEKFETFGVCSVEEVMQKTKLAVLGRSALKLLGTAVSLVQQTDDVINFAKDVKSMLETKIKQESE